MRGGPTRSVFLPRSIHMLILSMTAAMLRVMASYWLILSTLNHLAGARARFEGEGRRHEEQGEE
jgi:hypothetical protein